MGRVGVRQKNQKLVSGGGGGGGGLLSGTGE